MDEFLLCSGVKTYDLKLKTISGRLLIVQIEIQVSPHGVCDGRSGSKAGSSMTITISLANFNSTNTPYSSIIRGWTASKSEADVGG
jgi:hypothetical protein